MPVHMHYELDSSDLLSVFDRLFLGLNCDIVLDELPHYHPVLSRMIFLITFFGLREFKN